MPLVQAQEPGSKLAGWVISTKIDTLALDKTVLASIVGANGAPATLLFVKKSIPNGGHLEIEEGNRKENNKNIPKQEARRSMTPGKGCNNYQSYLLSFEPFLYVSNILPVKVDASTLSDLCGSVLSACHLSLFIYRFGLTFARGSVAKTSCVSSVTSLAQRKASPKGPICL